MLRGESQFTDTNGLLLNGPNGHRPRGPKCQGAPLLSLEETRTNLGETKNENKEVQNDYKEMQNGGLTKTTKKGKTRENDNKETQHD